MVYWAICGIISWYASLYICSFGTYRLVSISARATQPLNTKIITAIATNISFHLPEYILAITITALLTRFYGSSRLGLFAFIVGATALTFKTSIATLLSYIDYYDKLPTWVVSAFISSMIFVFLLLPAAAWAGSIIGNRWRQKISC
jgi:hypothetical protein